MTLAYRPGRAHRWLRRATQALAIVAVAVAPFLGGWQRLERIDLSSWRSPGTELPEALWDRLPRGDTAGAAHDHNRLLGGGLAIDYFGVPTVDPLAGALTLAAGAPTLKAIVALAIPLLVALVGGRIFCGWFCPFGALSRALAWLVELVPWSPRYRIPPRRPVRFVILGFGAVGGLLGAHVILYLALPHLLVQQSVYAAWLLGGGGAALGLLLGLIGAGLWLGPTTYCATLCPTGAALRLVGHKRVVHLRLAEPKDCGKTCRRCSLSCWLQLDPASGDPGPDCDLCGRCVPQCPKTNLRIGLGRGARKAGAAVVPALAILAGLASTAQAEGREGVQPQLVLAAERVVEGVTVAVDVVDQTGVRPYADADEELSGSDVSVFLARGERGPADERGLLPEREAYGGPLTVRIRQPGRVRVLRFDAPTSPTSTPRRTIYLRRVPLRLAPGDVVELDAIDGWLSAPVALEVPSQGVDTSWWTTLSFLLAGLALFAGLASLALAIPDRE